MISSPTGTNCGETFLPSPIVYRLLTRRLPVSFNFDLAIERELLRRRERRCTTFCNRSVFAAGTKNYASVHRLLLSTSSASNLLSSPVKITCLEIVNPFAPGFGRYFPFVAHVRNHRQSPSRVYGLFSAR